LKSWKSLIRWRQREWTEEHAIQPDEHTQLGSLAGEEGNICGLKPPNRQFSQRTKDNPAKASFGIARSTKPE
jgi:hypothetical protein